MTGNVDGFFGEAVGTALSSQKLEATRGAREYLVGLLADFAKAGRADKALGRPVTLMLDEALRAPPSERFERLKGLGDGSLYVSGFFREHLERRGIDPSYVSRVGATAYGTAASLLQGDDGGLDLFGELSQKFQRFVAVLREVADGLFASSVHDEESVLRLYERWQKTGSPRLGQELVSRGLVPAKAAGGIQ